MNNILTIIKKEFARFFKDYRLVLTTLIMPGLFIYVAYSIMGVAIDSNMSVDNNHEYTVYTINKPTFIDLMVEGIDASITIKESDNISLLKPLLTDKEIDLIISFPENFENDILTYDSQSGLKAPNVSIYYNSVDQESCFMFDTFNMLLNEYESSFNNKFDINNIEDKFDLATDKEVTGLFFSMMIPFLIIIFLFSGCMAIAPESISGEKERGTIATLLVTPIKRSELAIGKIISLSFIAIISSLSSFIGTILSLPNLMKMSGGESEGQLNANVYSASDYLYILLIIITTVLVIISVMSILSAFAKSVKEANTIISPFMIIVMVIGITSMFGNASTKSILYLIPFYNSVQSLSAILSFELNTMNIIITIVSNITYSLILVFILTKVFNNENVMFSK